MFYIWCPAYIVPGLMVLAGFAGQLLPGRKYRSPQGPLAPERQKFADSLFMDIHVRCLFFYTCFAGEGGKTCF